MSQGLKKASGTTASATSGARATGDRKPSVADACSRAEQVARDAGWSRHGTTRFGTTNLVSSYFYHRESDILDTESVDWVCLCLSQPRLVAALAKATGAQS